MSRLFLFFLFSFFISFNIVAKEITVKVPSDTEAFNPKGCHGTTTANNQCGKTLKEGEKPPTRVVHPPSGATEPFPTVNKQHFPINQPLPSLPEGGPQNCDHGLSGPNRTGAEPCCSDPSTCLGGEALSTFNDVNSIVTKAGPGLAMALQGAGKDMYKLCQAMQSLAGGGAGLSMAAKGACSSAISSCNSICDRDIAVRCEAYNQAKNKCLGSQDSNKETTFQSEAEIPATDIAKFINNKKQCEAQRAKAKDLAENVGEMANSALSAELCKQQTQIPKKQCIKNGGKWVDMECIMPEEEKEEERPTVALRGDDGSVIPQHAGAVGVGSESPPGSSGGESSGSGGNPDTGGGGKKAASPIAGPLGLPGLASDTADLDSDGDGSTGAGKGLVGGGSGLSGLGGLGGGGGFSPYKKGKNNEDDDDDDDGLSMGGGGFAGYGGGGGFGDSGNAYASLGLSKKKLDELKKKKGAQRVTASDAKGTHQNIFERISKRFQSLCQSKLDCR